MSMISWRCLRERNRFGRRRFDDSKINMDIKESDFRYISQQGAKLLLQKRFFPGCYRMVLISLNDSFHLSWSVPIAGFLTVNISTVVTAVGCWNSATFGSEYQRRIP